MRKQQKTIAYYIQLNRKKKLIRSLPLKGVRKWKGQRIAMGTRRERGELGEDQNPVPHNFMKINNSNNNCEKETLNFTTNNIIIFF